MAVSVMDINQVRRKAADPVPSEGGQPDFNDGELAGIIAAFPLATGGYDLNAAAAEVWGLKAALFAGMEERVNLNGTIFDYGARMEKALQMQKVFSEQASDTYRQYGSGQMTRDDIYLDGTILLGGMVDPLA